MLCAVRRAFPYGKLVITVDAAAKMAPLTTATKGMERQHMGRDRRDTGGGRVEKRLHFSEWMAGELENLGHCKPVQFVDCESVFVCVCVRKKGEADRDRKENVIHL